MKKPAHKKHPLVYNTLFAERGHMSLGRTAFWFIFAVALYRAWTCGIIDTSVIGLITLLLAYNSYKKWPSIDEQASKFIGSSQDANKL